MYSCKTNAVIGQARTAALATGLNHPMSNVVFSTSKTLTSY